MYLNKQVLSYYIVQPELFLFGFNLSVARVERTGAWGLVKQDYHFDGLFLCTEHQVDFGDPV
ncbi:hypothetical protein [Bacillus sp. JJ722]|uniref:hypothetical protein n=1 Tax=Bacillus sp. JJ722 TaxID=3122973 RepID=UPI002FFD81C4